MCVWGLGPGRLGAEGRSGGGSEVAGSWGDGAPRYGADAQGAGLGGGLWGWEALGPEAEEHEVIHPF